MKNKKKLMIVIPSYNEEEVLEKNMIELHDFLKKKNERLQLGNYN